MKKSTLLLSGTLLLCIGVQAQRIAAPPIGNQQAAISCIQAEAKIQPDMNRPADAKRDLQKKEGRIMRASQYPGDYPLITPCEGEEFTMIKNGYSYGYSWYTGIFTQILDGGISRCVKSTDGEKFFMQSPFFIDYYSIDSWIEGDIEGDIVTFTFPQLVYEQIYEDEPEYNSWCYAMKLEFISDDNSDEGWYYVTENQEFKFRIEEDGTLTSLEAPGTMIGKTQWNEPDGENKGGWAWQATGDIITSMQPNKYTDTVLPSDVIMSEWQLITGLSSRPLQIGVKDDTMYIAGLFNNSSMSDKIVCGKIDGDKVTFANGQYLGEYWSNSTLAFFDTGFMTEETDEDGSTYTAFTITEDITFTWDKTKNILSSDGAYCISSAPDKVIYYERIDNPRIIIPEENPVVTEIRKPVLVSFYDVDEEYDYDAEITFSLPTVTEDYTLLDTSRLYYQVFVDEDLYTFYDDEYELPEGVSEMTDVPYGYRSQDTYDFEVYGINHGFILHARGFDSLGVRILYKGSDKDIYSDIMWLPGYAPEIDAVERVDNDNEAISVRYYDLTGCAIERPTEGVMIKQTRYTDGTIKTTKIIRR